MVKFSFCQKENFTVSVLGKQFLLVQINVNPFTVWQGGRGWRAFSERKIIPQSFRRARICKFSRQKRRFLQLRKYWLFLA